MIFKPGNINFLSKWFESSTYHVFYALFKTVKMVKNQRITYILFGFQT